MAQTFFYSFVCRRLKTLLFFSLFATNDITFLKVGPPFFDVSYTTWLATFFVRPHIWRIWNFVDFLDAKRFARNKSPLALNSLTWCLTTKQLQHSTKIQIASKTKWSKEIEALKDEIAKLWIRYQMFQKQKENLAKW